MTARAIKSHAMEHSHGPKGGSNAHRLRFSRTRFIWDLTDNVGRAISSSDDIYQIPYKNLKGRPIKSHAKKRCHRPKRIRAGCELA